MIPAAGSEHVTVPGRAQRGYSSLSVRILHLCTSIDPAAGGPSNVLARLARVQAERAARSSGPPGQVSIIVADAPDAVKGVAAELEAVGVRVHAGGPGAGPFCKGPMVERLIRDALAAPQGPGTGPPDIVHIHGLWQHTPHFGARAARQAGVPVIFRPCGMLDPWSLNQGRIKKKLFLELRARRDLNGSAAIHYTTETERRLVEPLRLRPRAWVIPNGIDWSEFEVLPPKGRFRAAHGIDQRPLIVFLSRLHYKKGIELLLPAFAHAAPKDAVLALVGPGEGDYVQQLRALAADLGVRERVLFPGMLKGPARIEALHDADLFVLPSYQENFGVAVIEALAAGTPVLISDQVNIWEEVQAAGVGVATPCRTEAVGEALRRMLSDRERLQAMGAAGREWARKTFPWTAIAELVETMYRDVIGGKSA